MAITNFSTDLNRGRKGEQIVLSVCKNLYPEYSFKDVATNKDFYRKGDIIATNKVNGLIRFLEVKNDTRIATSRNVFCEEEIYYTDGYSTKGNMYSDYDIFCIVSEQIRTIYLIDFSKLKKIYKYFEEKEVCSKGQITYGYIVPIDEIKKHRALMATITY